jgi:hypothetical protein
VITPNFPMFYSVEFLASAEYVGFQVLGIEFTSETDALFYREYSCA